MFTKLVLASAVAIPLGLLGLSSAAMAASDWNPNSSYNPPYDIPIYKQTLHHPRAGVMHHAAMSCAAARQRVLDDGYRHVTTRECDGRTFVFNATRHGRAVVLHLDPRNGQVLHG